MTRFIWLASYPKSGNTWIRALFANLKAEGDEPSDINRLGQKYGIASSRPLFEDRTLLDSGLLTEGEIDEMRPGVYRDLAVDRANQASHPWLVKCHDAYTRLADGTPLVGGANAASGAIVVVRDPRDVALSFADHRGTSIDEVIELMCDPCAMIGRSVQRQRRQLRQRLLDWSSHVSSWLDQDDLPVRLVRYEDMEADTAAVLTAAARFAGLDVTNGEVAKAVRLSAFALLREQEEASGFSEGVRNRPFFKRGHSGAWREALSSDQAERIEAAHRTMMIRLGYGH